MKRRKGFYSISAVAQMFSVHQQTIRMYEKEGLIKPKRSEGGTRLFSEEDVDRLEEIIHLTHKMGVNIAGVEIIMKLQRKIKRMQQDMNKLFDETSGHLEEETELYKREVKAGVKRLAQMKKESAITTEALDEGPKEKDTAKKSEQNSSVFDEDESEWEIEYDDE